ncbi:MAG: tRNA U34 5-methylaminomethyl-2-thiouridine-forming methyltransferase MnmC [Octadecabacter sp.]|jgi:tRNA U34 5-methylaminomethyl-2-thiouridine-forming methyltransferase MnmC
MTDQQANVEWRDGIVPVSVQFDDPYYSLDDGVAETQHVFLYGNNLPTRFCDGFHVAELGFGTGLNFLVTLAAWRAADVTGKLHFTSFEAFPMQMAEMRHALQAFPDLPIDVFSTDKDLSVLSPTLDGPDFKLTVVFGDARNTLADWNCQANAWYLDGFSPAKNPELWEEALLTQVAAHTISGGTFATYTAAGFVRRGLASAGFTVSRVQGFGRKRHMTRGTLA